MRLRKCWRGRAVLGIIAVLLLLVFVLYSDSIRITKIENNSILEGEDIVVSQILFQDIPEMTVREIKNANSKIDVMMFKFDCASIAEALVTAHEQGIKVRVIVEERSLYMAMEGCGISVPDYLAQHGVETYIYSDIPNILHYKFVIIDDNTVLTGSQNFSMKDFANNKEVFLKMQSIRGGLSQKFSTQFNNICQDKHTRVYNEILSEDIQLSDKVSQDSTSARKYLFGSIEYAAFSPENESRDLVINTIDRSNNRILVMECFFRDMKIADALGRAKQRGVTVQVITDASGGGDMIGDYLKCMGAECMVYDKAGSLMHHKTMIVDDDMVMTGSLNLTQKSLTKDREFIFLVKSHELNMVLADEFMKIWQCDDVRLPKHPGLIPRVEYTVKYYMRECFELYRYIFQEKQVTPLKIAIAGTGCGSNLRYTSYLA